MNSAFRQDLIRTLCAAGIVCSLSACMGIGERQLVDQDGQPVSDAWVVIQREECLGAFPECKSTCVEVGVAKTDIHGNYSFRSGIGDRPLNAYREGYVEGYQKLGYEKYKFIMERGGRDSRFSAMDPVSGRIASLAQTAMEMNCSSAPLEQRKALIPVYKAMLKEASSIARFPEQQKEARKICGWIDATQYGPPHSPGTLPDEMYLQSVEPACYVPIDDSKERRILSAIARGDPEPIRRAAQEGFDFNRLLDGSNPPMITAVMKGSPEMIAVLAAAGAKADAVGRNGSTALEKAAGNSEIRPERRRAIVEALLEAGADPNRMDPSGYPPLMIIARKRPADVQTFELLLKHGARANQATSLSCDCIQPGETVLHIVTDPDLARIAIEHGANVNAKTKSGYTPLALLRVPDVMRILLDHGADPNIADNGGWTPLMHLLRGYDIGRGTEQGQRVREMAEMLVAAGARLDALNLHGLDAFHYTKDEALKERLRAIAASRNTGPTKRGN